MKVVLACPSKPKEPYRGVIEELARRSGVELIFADRRRLERIRGFRVVLDPRGREMGLEELREALKGRERVVFVVGGPEGIEMDADLRLSLGRFVVNHQIAMIVILDQIFRLLNPEHPYSKK